MFQLGVHAIISIIIYLIAIGLSFQAVKAIQLDKIIRDRKIVCVRMNDSLNLFL